MSELSTVFYITHHFDTIVVTCMPPSRYVPKFVEETTTEKVTEIIL